MPPSGEYPLACSCDGRFLSWRSSFVWARSRRMPACVLVVRTAGGVTWPSISRTVSGVTWPLCFTLTSCALPTLLFPLGDRLYAAVSMGVGSQGTAGAWHQSASGRAARPLLATAGTLARQNAGHVRVLCAWPGRRRLAVMPLRCHQELPFAALLATPAVATHSRHCSRRFHCEQPSFSHQLRYCFCVSRFARPSLGGQARECHGQDGPS